MLRAARKESGNYTEGVVLADKLQCLFRNVPPPLALALAMTEKHEKQQRAEIMKAQHCSGGLSPHEFMPMPGVHKAILYSKQSWVGPRSARRVLMALGLSKIQRRLNLRKRRHGKNR